LRQEALNEKGEPKVPSLREEAANEQGEPKVPSLREEALNEQGEPKVLPVTSFLRFLRASHGLRP
jgi:hypothetical protein